MCTVIGRGDGASVSSVGSSPPPFSEDLSDTSAERSVSSKEMHCPVVSSPTATPTLPRRGLPTGW